MIFAKVENNEVVDVIVIEDRFTSEEEAQAFIRDECKFIVPQKEKILLGLG
jgi:hypothetical protein